MVAKADVELTPLATSIGEAWAAELVRSLRANDREVVGAWPGTRSEARMRVLARVHAKLETQLLDELATRVVRAARQSWQQVTQPDLEP